jgi:hypothetical protein
VGYEHDTVEWFGGHKVPNNFFFPFNDIKVKKILP